MNKRILTLVLALVMILGLAVTSFAAPEVEKITNPKVQWLIDKNIVVGRLQDDGKTKVFDLDKTITREEVAKLVILYRGSENLARSLQGTKGIFKDVAIDRWSNGYINVAALADLIVGYPDGNFGPDKDITYAEIAAILVRMNSKWTAADEKAAIWPISFIKAAEEFGILKGIKLEDANAPAVREKVFEMMYNAFDGKYQAPIVNDRLGVISKVWGNSIQLNGDAEYKITDKTIFVGDTLNKLFKANDFFGSLVRIAINDDNEITHLIALGAKGFAYEKDKWEGLIDEKYGNVFVVKGTTLNPADIEATSDNDKVVFLSGLTLKITDKTRFFVADPDKNNFFEAKKLSDAIDTKEPAHLQKVYAAYDVQPVTGDAYAKVVVFSSGKEAPANKNLARITASVGAGYDFKAEDTKAVETEYSVAKANKFPYNYKLRKMDVVNLHMSGDKDVVDFDPIIDYNSDPVYRVISIGDVVYQKDGTAKFEGSKIKLEDASGNKAEYALPVDGVSVFTNALGKGAKVQVHFDKDDARIIDVISKVDKDLEGLLPGYVDGGVCGTLVKFDMENTTEVAYLILAHDFKEFSKGDTVKFNVGVNELSLLETDLDAKFGTDFNGMPGDEGKDMSAWNIMLCGIAKSQKDLNDLVLTSITFDEKAAKACQDEFTTLAADLNTFVAAQTDGVAAPATLFLPKASPWNPVAPYTTMEEQVEAAEALVARYEAKPCVTALIDGDGTASVDIAKVKAALENEEKAPRPSTTNVTKHIDEIKAEIAKLEKADAVFADNTALQAYLNGIEKTSLINTITVPVGTPNAKNPKYADYSFTITGLDSVPTTATIECSFKTAP